MKKKFKCSCRTHIIEIHYTNVSEYIKVNPKTKKHKKCKENVPELWIGIYDIYNPDTGRKYKKPKLIGDVWFMLENPHDKEMESLMKFLEEVIMAYVTRRK